MIKYIFLIVVSLFVLNSCMEDESPVKPYPRLDSAVKTSTISMTSKYTNQVYFSFQKGEPVFSFVYDIWDIGFRSYGDNGYQIILNGAKFMAAADLGPVKFETADTSNATFSYDSTNGDYDHYAIGRWWELDGSKMVSKNHVYVINRGTNNSFRKLGVVKFMVLGFENNEYKIRFANLDNSNDFTASIPRNELHNFSYFSFSDGGKVVSAEPPSQDWDIFFNRYVATLVTYDSINVPTYTPYIVTGITINDRYVEVASDTSMVFDKITLDSITKLTFSKRPDYIGHEWKTFNLTGESYAVRPEINYFLKDKDGFFWKFHFTFFYNEEGERGFPKFDFKRL